MNDLEADLLIANAKIKQLEEQLSKLQPANEPLTLEELSEMSDTDWVWVMFPELAPEESGWHRAKRLYDTYSKSHYSKTWLAYRRKPEWSENE